MKLQGPNCHGSYLIRPSRGLSIDNYQTLPSLQSPIAAALFLNLILAQALTGPGFAGNNNTDTTLVLTPVAPNAL